MARKHYWQFLVSDEGNPIENADITVYFAGTEDPAWVYTDSVGSAGSGDLYQVSTSLKGYFEFWVPDETEPNGHPLSTKFKVGWVANGVSDGYIDEIDMFGTFIQEVDITSSDELRNKTVSNFLAKGWEDHKNATYPGAEVHGIRGVDVDLALPVGDDIITDGDLSKLLSNYLGRTWETHTRTLWDDSVDITSIPDTVHGIDVVDETITGTMKNKLVSNTLAKYWNDHANNTPLDPHPQYMMVSGDDGVNGENFTGLVGYSNGTIVNSADVNDFITKAYVDNSKYTELLTIGGWALVNGFWERTVTHNLGDEWPMIILWRTHGTPDQVVQPEAIETINSNSFKVVVGTPEEFFIRVMI